MAQALRTGEPRMSVPSIDGNALPQPLQHPRPLAVHPVALEGGVDRVPVAAGELGGFGYVPVGLLEQQQERYGGELHFFRMASVIAGTIFSALLPTT